MFVIEWLLKAGLFHHRLVGTDILAAAKMSLMTSVKVFNHSANKVGGGCFCLCNYAYISASPKNTIAWRSVFSFII